jgi:hypothetical protein
VLTRITSTMKHPCTRAGLLPVLALALGGCATQRVTAPTVTALPAVGEDFAAFQQHDTTCRQYAASQTGGKSPGQAAAQNGAAGAAVGAGVGAAAGALLGSATGRAGNGAAIGAGSGLLLGTVMGSASGRNAAAAVQRQYNMSYTQCMVANGERIASPAPPAVLYPMAPPPRVIYVPAPAYAVPPPPPPYGPGIDPNPR